MLRCKLLLSQANHDLEITVDKMTGGAMKEVFSQWGKFSSSEGNIPPERKVWLHALAKWELRLMDGGGPGVGMGGGGLKYGELAAAGPAAILSGAVMTARGVEPYDRSGVGTGRLDGAAGMSVYFHNGPITWRLLSYQEYGASGWKNA